LLVRDGIAASSIESDSLWPSPNATWLYEHHQGFRLLQKSRRVVSGDGGSTLSLVASRYRPYIAAYTRDSGLTNPQAASHDAVMPQVRQVRFAEA